MHSAFPRYHSISLSMVFWCMPGFFALDFPTFSVRLPTVGPRNFVDVVLSSLYRGMFLVLCVDGKTASAEGRMN